MGSGSWVFWGEGGGRKMLAWGHPGMVWWWEEEEEGGGVRSGPTAARYDLHHGTGYGVLSMAAWEVSVCVPEEAPVTLHKDPPYCGGVVAVAHPRRSPERRPRGLGQSGILLHTGTWWCASRLLGS